MTVIAENKVNIDIYSSYILGIEVGFDPNIYNVSVSDDMVLVCVAIFEGTLERDVTLLMLILSNEKSTGIDD